MPLKETIRVVQTGSRKVKIFVDFWNVVINARQQSENFDVRVQWDALSKAIVNETSRGYGDETTADMAGCHIFGSFSRSDPREQKFINETLDEFGSDAGLFFDFKERVRKQTSSKCKSCGTPLERVSELGVDVLLTVEMIKHSFMKEHDYLALVSGDRDYIPLLAYLKDQGQRVLHVATGESHRDMRSLTWKQIALKDRYISLSKIHHDGLIIFHTPNHAESLDQAQHIARTQGIPVLTIDVSDKEQISDKDLRFLLSNNRIYVTKSNKPSHLRFDILTVAPNLQSLRDGLRDGSIDGQFPRIFRNGMIEAHRDNDHGWMRFADSPFSNIWDVTGSK